MFSRNRLNTAVFCHLGFILGEFRTVHEHYVLKSTLFADGSHIKTAYNKILLAFRLS